MKALQKKMSVDKKILFIIKLRLCFLTLQNYYANSCAVFNNLPK